MIHHFELPAHFRILSKPFGKVKPVAVEFIFIDPVVGNGIQVCLCVTALMIHIGEHVVWMLGNLVKPFVFSRRTSGAEVVVHHHIVFVKIR